VQDHQVPGTDHHRQLAGGRHERTLVHLACSLVQAATVAGEAVQVVVDSLGDTEELRVARDRQPARVQSRSVDVADQRPQHLGHSAASRRRVDVPDGAVAERLPRRCDRLLEPLVLPHGEHGDKAL
jgi:hypothetical protein